MKPKQLSFFPKLKSQFGGSLLTGQRKSKRPLTSKSPIHVIIKSEKARASLSFVNHQRKMSWLIDQTARKFNIRIYEKAVNFNHCHIVLLLPDLASYAPWIRELTAKIVAYLQTKTLQSLGGFFECRPFTRIVTWGRDFKGVTEYQIQNHMEIVGLRPAKTKKKAKSSTEKSYSSPSRPL